MVDQQGVYDIPIAEYLQDPAPEPSLSAGIAHTLLERSPWHAWHEHPRLGARAAQDYRRDAAIGTVFHAMFLGQGAEYVILDCDDFKTKAAREARDEATLLGKTALKASDFETVEAMIEAASTQLERHQIGNITNRPGKAEQTLIWQEENGVWCRARPDWMPDDLAAEPYIYNLKTSTCAHPDVWARRLFESGYDLSACHYCRAVDQALGNEVNERFVVVETDPPYALSVVEMSPGSLAMAERRRAAAVGLWGECLRRGEWPGYPRRVATVELPSWKESIQVEREISGRYDHTQIFDDLTQSYGPIDRG